MKKVIIGVFCKYFQAIWPLDAKHDVHTPHLPPKEKP